MNLLPMNNPTTVDMGENIAYIERKLMEKKEQTMEEQPKACPFCGWGTIVDETFWLPNKHVCKCNACGARTRICRSWEDAVRLWNTRNR